MSMNEEEKISKLNPIIMHNWTGKYNFHEYILLDANPIITMNGKVMIRAFPRDVRHKGIDLFGNPIIDENILKTPHELIFFESQIKKYAQGTISKNRQYFEVMPTEFEINNSDTFKKTRLFEFISPYLNENNTLREELAHMIEYMKRQTNMILMFCNGELMKEVMLKEVKDMADYLGKIQMNAMQRQPEKEYNRNI